MQILRLSEVMTMTGLARSTIYKYIALESFPKPLKLGSRTSRWLRSDIENWILQLCEQRKQNSA